MLHAPALLPPRYLDAFSRADDRGVVIREDDRSCVSRGDQLALVAAPPASKQKAHVFTT